MLIELYIKEFALIHELRLEVGPGLTIITGETGAGKSIVIDALSAAVGDRVASDVIRSGANEAIVEATFEASTCPKALQVAAKAGIDTETNGLLILTRILSTTGRHRCRVNGRAVPLALLREIGDCLVDIHGQHEHQALIREENHLQFLDAYAGPEVIQQREAYQRTFSKLRAAQAARSRLVAATRDRLREVDLLRFQVKEIESADLSPDEEEELQATRTRLVNARRLGEGINLAHHLLIGGSEELLGAVDAAREALARLQELAALDPSLNDIGLSLENATYQLEDTAARLADYLKNIDDDPEALDEIEGRLALIAHLKRKYGDSIEEIIRFAKQASERLTELDRADERLAELEREVEQLEREAGIQATELSSRRRATASELSRVLSESLVDVGMLHGRLEVELYQKPSSAGIPDEQGQRWSADERGIDRCRFLFSANPGEPVKPLAMIASGGELSRLMLVLKSVCSRAHEIPTMVFDEVDAGIGGQATHAVGAKLADLSRRAQVLCVTHLPQIARHADHHFHAAKHTREGRTLVTLRELQGEERLVEVARMLGARKGDRAALEHAAELLARRLTGTGKAAQK